MKISLIFCLLLCFSSVFCQNNTFPKNDSVYQRTGKRSHAFEEGDTLYTKSGYKFYCHQILKIGSGSGEKGYFRYIFLVNPNNTDLTGVGGFVSVDRHFLRGSKSFVSQSSYNSRLDITSSMAPYNSGKEFVVVNLKVTGSKNIGYRCLPVIAEPIDGYNRDKFKVALERYYIDYENAVNTGELIYPDKLPFNKNQSSIEVKVVQEKNETISIPDELAKLKKLYDSGAISKEEYDVAKKKLLDKL